MKKLTIIGSALIAVGLIVFTAAFGASGWNIDKLATDSEHTEHRESFDCTNQDILVKETSGNIKIVPSEDDKIHLICWESEDEAYEVTEGETLKIEKTEHYKWYERLFSFRIHSYDVTVMVPEGYTGNIDVETGSGSLEVQGITADNISVNSDNGEIEVRDTKAAGSVNTGTSNGNITVDSTSAGSMLKAVTSNGSVEIKSAAANDITAESSLGSIELADVSVSGETHVKSGNGDIRTDNFVPGTVTELRTDLGEIGGSIAGELRDFTVSSYTDLGENSLPESLPGGEKELIVKTDMGDIDITFIK